MSNSSFFCDPRKTGTSRARGSGHRVRDLCVGMDAAGRMGRGTRRAGRMCGLQRWALVSFACVALLVFLAASHLATREDRGDARLTRAPRLWEHRTDEGTAENDSWLQERQRARGVDARRAHDALARTVDGVQETTSSSRYDGGIRPDDATTRRPQTPPKAHHMVVAGKYHNKRYTLRGYLVTNEEDSRNAREDPRTTNENDADDDVEDPAVSAVLRSMSLAPGSLVALTFGDAKMLSMVLNWSAHLHRLNVPHVVGALDDATSDALASRSIPTFRCILGDGSERLDGGSGHASDNWKRFAMTRIAKVRAVLELGYDVLMSDADVVWRRDPRRYLQCPETAVDAADRLETGKGNAPCEAIAAADVMVSSDNLSPKTDARQGALYARGGVFNTGIVFLKRTPGAKAFAKAWLRHLGATGNSRFAHLTSDQQVFNAMTRREGEWPGLDPIDHHAEAPEALGGPTRVLEAGLGLPSDDAGASVDGFRAFKLGVLPIATFQPGHVAFLQRVDEMAAADLVHVFGEAGDDASAGAADAASRPSDARERRSAPRRAKREPYCVHATYTFDGSTAEAKRFRFAEFGLWDPKSDLVAEPEPSRRPTTTDPVDDASRASTSGRTAIRDERRFLTYDPRRALETAFGAPFETVAGFEPDIGAHLKAGAAQLRALRDATAIARVLNRTLAVPTPFCFCDKTWGGHDNVFTFNCHYPGSADSGHVPGACPLDHLVSPSAMRRAGLDFVALGELPSFLDETDSVLEVVSGSRRAESIATRGGEKRGAVAIPASARERDVRDALERRGARARDARLVRLSDALDAFGGFDDVDETRRFDALVRDAIAPEEWCSECHPRGCAALVDAKTLALGTTRAVREVHDQFCARFERPTDLARETNAARAEAKDAEPARAAGAALHDADGDDVVVTLGSLSVDEETANAGRSRF